MSKRFVMLTLIVSVSLILPIYGQKSTEIYIPIGKSPGLSGKYSVVGKIHSFDSANRVLTIRGEEGERSAKITEETKIWLDKSELKMSNRVGSQVDCRKGRLCEVKYVYTDENRTEEAEWIKIRVSQPD